MFALGALGAESACTAAESDNNCNVQHQMRVVLKKTFSLLFRVLVRILKLIQLLLDPGGDTIKNQKEKNFILLKTCKVKYLK